MRGFVTFLIAGLLTPVWLVSFLCRMVQFGWTAGKLLANNLLDWVTE